MDKTIAENWVKALRSGKYKQTRGNLRNPSGHCCLGVLCAISPYKSNYTKMTDVDGDINSKLPTKVKEWAGMKTSDGEYKPFPFRLHLVRLNDDEGFTFDQIADVIEQNIDNL